MPRIALPGASEIALPQPLLPGDAARIRRAFALQERGAIAEAAHEIDGMDDTTLLGPLLADRYLRDRHVVPSAIATWLERYGDEPDAPAIRALLRRLAPPAEEHEHHKFNGLSRSARGLFIENRDAEAVAVAETRGDADSLLAGGLAAFRMQKADVARGLFERAWRARANNDQRATAAFWAARVAQDQADYSAALGWRRSAAEETGTFYGILAARMLAPARACVRGETLSIADIAALMATPAGKRAFALLQVGQRRRAEREFLALWAVSGGHEALKQSLLLVSQALNMPALSAEMQAGAAKLEQAVGYTTPPQLRPRGGFVVETPLVYAVVRHESNFQPAAVSGAGAQGLMQLMSATANAVAGVQGAKLRDPAINLAVGQRYLLSLAADESVGDDLIRVLAGYGQGLNGLKRWADTVRDNGDPLLFLEAIPDRSVRQYVASTLAYDWQYAAALRVRPSSLDALAGGERPVLVHGDGGTLPPPGCGAVRAR